MKIQANLFVFALSCLVSGCGTVSETGNDNPSVAIGAESLEAQNAPAPAGEVAVPADAVPADAVPAEFAHLQTFDAEQFAYGELAKGRYVGNLVIEQQGASLRGSGVGETVIDGNLIVGTMCTVTGLTVTGDVIFTGNSARVTVNCRGQVLDYGMQNQH